MPDNRNKNLTDEEIEKMLEGKKNDTEDTDNDEKEEFQNDVEEKEDKNTDAEESKEEEFYKEKFKNSTRENQIIKADNDNIYRAYEEAENITVTDDEIKAKAKEWGRDPEDLDEFDKQVLRDSILNSKKVSKITEAARATKQTNDWINSIDTFVDDERNVVKYPILGTKADEFKRYCMKERNRNLDLDILIKAFSFELPEQYNKPKRKTLVMDGSGSTGDNKSAKLTAQDAKRLRDSNRREYDRLVRAGAFAHLAEEL